MEKYTPDGEFPRSSVWGFFLTGKARSPLISTAWLRLRKLKTIP